ncbi:DUF7533 family protein [Halovivax limisalsi]|uniref:DUF7533 family protein n=1 Tax=Halovivax limisalsi TaxID=1453760 RepID=UPI001FFC3BA2|nr:hypothetical protein [Halovivax limisalsi]
MAGILETFKLAGTLIFAIPAGLAGLDLLVRGGEPVIGGGLVVAALALVAFERYLSLPTDVPAEAAERVGGAVAVDPDDENE